MRSIHQFSTPMRYTRRFSDFSKNATNSFRQIDIHLILPRSCLISPSQHIFSSCAPRAHILDNNTRDLIARLSISSPLSLFLFQPVNGTVRFVYLHRLSYPTCNVCQKTPSLHARHVPRAKSSGFSTRLRALLLHVCLRYLFMFFHR